MNDAYSGATSFLTRHLSSISNRKFYRGLVLLFMLCTGVPALAGTITYEGLQTWENEFNPDDGTWFVNTSSLEFFAFTIPQAAIYDFGITPGSWLSPLGTLYEPRTRMYSPVVQEGNSVFPGLFPGPVFMEPGDYVIVVGYGDFEGDEATESGENFWGLSGSPEPFADIPFELTITGPGIGVPEPGVMLLMLSGLLGLSSRSRSRGTE